MKNKIKTHGQIYTPQNITKQMIDLSNVDFSKINSILEPSAGNGQMLDVLFETLGEKDFYKKVTAIELDPDNVSLIQEKYKGIKIISGNTMELSLGLFDYIIGNPPYVRIHNIDISTKAIIEKFEICNGMYDLYQAFYEWGVNHLAKNGTLVYIAPNSWLTNAGDDSMRNFFSKKRNIVTIKDFGSELVFKDASTYTAIVVIRNGHKETGEYVWEKKHTKINSFMNVQNGISTNRDSVFIRDDLDENEPVVRAIYKASTEKFGLCIYPYDTNGKVIDIEDIKKKSPKAYSILVENKEELAKRNMDSKLNWWEYARTQGISNMLKSEKTAISTMYKDKLKTKQIDKDTVVYSGLFIPSYVVKVDDELMTYLNLRAGHKRGGWRTFNSSVLKNY